MDKNNIMRKLPKVADLLEETEIKDLMTIFNRNYLTDILRESLETVRVKIMEKLESGDATDKSENELKDEVISLAINKLSFSPYSLRPVINATGVVLHTNLGRAPLPEEAMKRIEMVAKAYSNLEFDIGRGERGERYSHVRELLCDITGAEDAMVVNNNAAAVLLCLSSLASGHEVVISRGQLVEIGGSFRIPDVMAQSGARLVEVGTTNKTHLKDYEMAINENTALLLKVHTSNFKLVGFTSQVSNEELITLGAKHNLPVMEDLGSGVLVDLKPYSLPEEPTVQDSVKAGMDLVTFSGDKLLGGPQAGIIVGKKGYISKIKRHPLTRAVRIDKLTLAALEAVLRLYKDGLWQHIPVLAMLTESKDAMENRARKLAEGLEGVLTGKGKVEIVDDVSQAGGGSLPGAEIPTRAVAVSVHDISSGELAERLRKVPTPVIARIKKDKLLFDVRTITEKDVEKIVEMVGKAL
ncbi:L-seryl-tRNA(Sec) selenium transferase [Biomaibacter acetigenes]|uniref:L-seryl-tRNA(Sec) selenium transferase n=1 Tax=Biomaibacter acetigenes TaxID=2316383 RepID=A0A3G2R6B9_9FIRM|nr:L-seryl-tRNA(Sec) selenium transferase [Biomaibacter acetigenes]AYO30946.1 L-seryl-tRNA(Sec) selenium transferase [Biomaibacter acetigenes]